MNYEEKYKEALERAKKFEEKYGGDYAGYIFPELAESEDERIRKWLVNYFKEVGKSWIHRDINPEQIIDYLEKQKEQKPAEWNEEDWKLLDEVREHIIGVIGDKPDLTPNKIYDGFLDLIDKLKFAKPQLKQEWSKEDKDVIDEAAELALGWGCPNLSAKLKSILSRVKPAEWSEEDELGKKHLEGYCMGREDTLREMKDFVESHFTHREYKSPECGTCASAWNTSSGTSTLKAEG